MKVLGIAVEVSNLSISFKSKSYLMERENRHLVKDFFFLADGAVGNECFDFKWG